MNVERIEDVTEWKSLEGIEDLQYSILHINEEQTRAEVLFKMEAHKPIILHRHCALNKIVVLSGQHHIYHADGTLKEVRATGSYTVSQPDIDPHSESGGEGGTVLLFSIFDNDGGPLYELMDADQNVVGTLSMSDLVELSK
ncbi:MAG: regulator [Pseudomonadota bacterium]